MTIRMIAAVAKNGVIVCGRKTWETLPKSLAPKTAVILASRGIPSRRPICDSVVVADAALSVNVAFAFSRKKADVWIIGGASVYEMFMPIADELVISRIDLEPEGDAFFPEIGPEWRLLTGARTLVSRLPWIGVEIYQRRLVRS